MQSTVAALLLLTSSVILGCIVVDYAVNIVQSTLQTTNIPQLDQLRGIQSSLLNQTDTLFNQTSTVPENNIQQTPPQILPQNLSSSVFVSLP